MERILFILVLFSVSFSSCAQRNYTAKKLLFSQVQKPYLNYGYLYNWYAVVDTGNITNTGWHIPEESELTTLTTYLGGLSVSGGKLKETGLTYWLTPNTGATNEVLFNGRGGGIRSSTGDFSVLKNTLGIVTSNNVNSTLTRYISILYNSISSIIGNGNKRAGFSIRILKDSTTLTHGQSGTYTGNDGKIYRTICIGTQEWLADNLAETKYRNGDWITGYDGGVYTPIANAAWAALTTEAMCVYNDNESYR